MSVQYVLGKTAMGAASYRSSIDLRVRYSETDQMGTFYNSRALEWFEVGRTELLRAAGIAYASMEQRGTLLPLVEAHIKYEGRARYDDLLQIDVSAAIAGKASLRFDYRIIHKSTGAAVTGGYTVHAITDSAGKPSRTPQWVVDALSVGPGESSEP
jgi:acyl-CoA thioester hydrolase